MGSLQCVPAIVMYPACGPVWHGQSLVRGEPALVMDPGCVPVWHGQSSVRGEPALVGTCWSKQQCPVLRQKMVVYCSRSSRRIESFRLSGTGWNVRLMKACETGCCGCRVVVCFLPLRGQVVCPTCSFPQMPKRAGIRCTGDVQRPCGDVAVTERPGLPITRVAPTNQNVDHKQ